MAHCRWAMHNGANKQKREAVCRSQIGQSLNLARTFVTEDTTADRGRPTLVAKILGQEVEEMRHASVHKVGGTTILGDDSGRSLGDGRGTTCKARRAATQLLAPSVTREATYNLSTSRASLNARAGVPRGTRRCALGRLSPCSATAGQQRPQRGKHSGWSSRHPR